MAGKFKLFSKVGKTRIIPIGFKILLIFISIILLSNLATNIVTIQMSKRQIITLNNTVMVDQLKDLYTNASNQYQIYQYSNNLDEINQAMEKSASSSFENNNSLALGVDIDGNIKFFASNNPAVNWTVFKDEEALQFMNHQLTNEITDGSISFSSGLGEYFGVYKYQKDWDYYLIRAELRKEAEATTTSIYITIVVMIVLMTIFFIVIGYIMINHEFRTVREITEDLYEMQQKKELGLIDLSNAANDDVTYLAASFNVLSSSVNHLLGTFQKFVSKDVVAKAYSGDEIRLEGQQQELVMLFSDIKSFTYRTETLGNDIIDVLNVHYDRVIRKVHDNSGVVGSIIGDAILAVYGTLSSKMSKSYEAIASAWEITYATAALRESMQERRIEIEKKRKLTESEERVYQAVMLDVGVGIDGGNVFYGNIGSSEHMANTVIGDNVNSASRLEGLTRVYHIPVIVSEYVKNEVEKESARYKFFEIDTVQVKGKTTGKKIDFPFDTNSLRLIQFR